MRTELTVSARALAGRLDEVLRARAGLTQSAYAQLCEQQGHRPGTKKLAAQADVSQRTLGRVFAGSPDRVSLWMADRLLRAAGVPSAVLHDLHAQDGDLVWEAWETGLSEDCLHVPDDAAV